jgi:hypothetical protein
MCEALGSISSRAKEKRQKDDTHTTSHELDIFKQRMPRIWVVVVWRSSHHWDHQRRAQLKKTVIQMRMEGTWSQGIN